MTDHLILTCIFLSSACVLISYLLYFILFAAPAQPERLQVADCGHPTGWLWSPAWQLSLSYQLPLIF